VSDREPVAALIEAYSQLLSLAVHELRTPTSVVGGYLRMLQRDSEGSLSERQRKMIDDAARSCGRIAELINEMSDISKLDGGTAPVRLETFDLFPVVQEVAEGLVEGRDREVRLEVRGDAAGARMAGDLGRLRGAFSACFRAIVREQPSPSTVVAERRLPATANGAEAMILVAPENDVNDAWDAAAEPFDDKRGGLGLALPLARRVLERHGGRIWSPAVEGGARARALVVSIPLPELNR
jgi:signal transduction histidine kinase